jgi:hypothetical protein
MSKTFRVILIDPDEQHVSETEWDGSLDTLHAMVGAEALGHFRLAFFDEDRHLDCGWVDDVGLSRGLPIRAFLLPTAKDPVAGKCVVVGADAYGETSDCRVPIAILRQDVTWLGLIRPEVVWDHTDTGSRAIVTYARVKHP